MRRARLVLMGSLLAVSSVPRAAADVLIPLPTDPAAPESVRTSARSPSLDDGGGLMAFSDFQDVGEGDTNGQDDVFVRDLDSGDIRLVSVSSTGAQGNGPSFLPLISGNGDVVLFLSHANNLVARDRRDCAPDDVVDDCRTQLYLHDLTSGRTILVSHNASGRPSRYSASEFDVSDDGRLVAFASFGQPLDPTYPPSGQQVHVFDRADRSITLASVSSDGAFAREGAGDPALSGDGRWLIFTSLSDLAPGASSALFARDLLHGTTERLPGYTFGQADISDDGMVIAGHALGEQVQVLDRSDGTITHLSPPEGTYPEVHGDPIVLSGDGSTVVYRWDDAIDDYPPIQWVIADVATSEQTNHEFEADGFTISRDGSRVAFDSDEADPLECRLPAHLWLLDRTVPTPAPTPPVFTSQPDVTIGGGLVREGIPVRITWSATDDEQLRFFVIRSGPGGGESEQLIDFNFNHLTEQVARDRLRLGISGLPYAVSACDSTTSTRALAPMFVMQGPQENSEHVAYEGTWVQVRASEAWRNGLSVVSEAGAAATLAFDGSQVAWVARTGPRQGSATVSVDGAVVATVDLFEAERRNASIVFRWRGEPGPHTLRIETLGSEPVSLDGFAVIHPTEDE